MNQVITELWPVQAGGRGGKEVKNEKRPDRNPASLLKSNIL